MEERSTSRQRLGTPRAVLHRRPRCARRGSCRHGGRRGFCSPPIVASDPTRSPRRRGRGSRLHARPGHPDRLAGNDSSSRTDRRPASNCQKQNQNPVRNDGDQVDVPQQTHLHESKAGLTPVPENVHHRPSEKPAGNPQGRAGEVAIGRDGAGDSERGWNNRRNHPGGRKTGLENDPRQRPTGDRHKGDAQDQRENHEMVTVVSTSTFGLPPVKFALLRKNLSRIRYWRYSMPARPYVRLGHNV